MRTTALLATALLLGPGLAPPPGQQADIGIRSMFVMRIPEGKQVEARQIALRMLNYLEANHPDDPVRLEVFQETGEGFDRMYWFLDAPDIASFERNEGLLASEEGWKSLMDERDATFQLKPRFMLPASELGPRSLRKPLRWVKKLRASHGNYAAALRHARAVADYVNANTEDTWAEVYRGVIDETGVIYTFTDWQSPDHWRRLELKLWQDEEFLQLMEQGAGLYEDDLWEEVPLAGV